MSDEKNKSQEMLFLQLILMFQTAALQQMGKLANPLTQKVEKDLEQAKFSIDILGMLEEKTRGNLSEEEKKFLDHVLYELRMNYLDESKEGEKGENKEKKETEEGKSKEKGS
jgi:predicted nucleotide-binding protein